MLPHRIRLEKCQPSANRYRFYALAVEPTLFGGWSLVREWGRIGGRTSQTRVSLHETLQAAESAYARKLREKRKRQQFSFWLRQGFRGCQSISPWLG